MQTRTLSWDSSETAPWSDISAFGINTCHAALWLRDDLPLHLLKIRKNLKMKYIRCHGILNDDLMICREDGSFDFEKVLTVLRRIRRTGLRPFLELSSMPAALSRAENTSTVYRFRCDPPREWDRWRQLIRDLMRALLAEFGIRELRKWYFEIWNEPDLDPWFWKGTQQEYFRLYDIARNEIKRCSGELRVGGPATSRTMWIPEFLRHCAAGSPDDPDGAGLRFDFISTHAYASDKPFQDQEDASPVALRPAAILRTLFSRVRAEMDAAGASDRPLFIGEWNSSSGPIARNHDDCANAAFICKTMAELSGVCSGSLYWNATDIYEECGFHYAPFHGGYGLISVNGIPKSSFHAFRFLASLRGRRVKCALSGDPCEEHGALAVADSRFLRILIWNYRSPDSDGIPLRLKLPASSGPGMGEWILPEHGSAYESWVKAGEPEYPTLPLLRKLTRSAVCRREQFQADAELEIPSGAVVLLTFPASSGVSILQHVGGE